MQRHWNRSYRFHWGDRSWGDGNFAVVSKDSIFIDIYGNVEIYKNADGCLSQSKFHHSCKTVNVKLYSGLKESCGQHPKQNNEWVGGLHCSFTMFHLWGMLDQSKHLSKAVLRRTFFYSWKRCMFPPPQPCALCFVADVCVIIHEYFSFLVQQVSQLQHKIILFIYFFREG